MIVTIAEHGSLVRAAHVLGISQSALTHSLATIEETPGAPLLVSSHRGIQPNNVGGAILVEGRELSKRLEGLETADLTLSRVHLGSLTVSSSTAAPDVLLAPAKAVVIVDFPDTRIELLPSDHVTTARPVQAGEALFGATALSELEEPPHFDITPCGTMRW